MLFQLLQKIGHLHVGVAVVGVLDLAALAEQSVALVEEEDAPGVPRLLKDRPQVLFGLADVLADDLGQIDLVQLHVQLVGDDLGAHGLAGARLPREEDGQPPAVPHLAVKAPAVVHLVLMADVPAGLLHQPLLLVGQDDVLPGIGGGHPAGQLSQAVDRLPVAALMQQLPPDGPAPLEAGQAHRLRAGRRDLPRGKAELGRDLFQAAVLRQLRAAQRAAQQLEAVLLAGHIQRKLHRQAGHPGGCPLGRQVEPLARQAFQLVQPGHHRPVGGAQAAALGPVEMVQAQAGVGEVCGEGGFLRPGGPVLPFQVGKDAAALAPCHQMGDLEFFAGAPRPGQQYGAGGGACQHGVQPAGGLLPDGKRGVGGLLCPVVQPQPVPGRDRPGGEVLHHHRPQGQVALRQLVGVEQPQKAPPPGKAGQIALGLRPRRQKQLHRQRGVGGLAGHVVLQVGVQLLVFAVHLGQVGQRHAAALEVVQLKPPEQLQQRQAGGSPPGPHLDGRQHAVQLPPLAGGQLALQPPLRRPAQVMLKLFLRDHQPQHVFQLAVRAQPLMPAVILIEQQVHPGGQLFDQLALGLIAGVRPAGLQQPQFAPLHAAPHGVCTVRAGVMVTWITPP